LQFIFANLGNEWKTRFENQEEINKQLSKQISLLESKLEDIKSKAKNGLLSYYLMSHQFIF